MNQYIKKKILPGAYMKAIFVSAVSLVKTVWLKFDMSDLHGTHVSLLMWLSSKTMGLPRQPKPKTYQSRLPMSYKVLGETILPNCCFQVQGCCWAKQLESTTFLNEVLSHGMMLVLSFFPATNRPMKTWFV